MWHNGHVHVDKKIFGEMVVDKEMTEPKKNWTLNREGQSSANMIPHWPAHVSALAD
jgi:hypothetical protein